MRNSTNYSLLLPDKTDTYNVDEINNNMEIIDAQMKSNQTKADATAQGLNTHTGNKSNPHGVTKEQLGLGNVPNVSTNNQTPTYTVPSTLSALVSGEVLSTAFGKLAKAVSDFISHLGNKNNPHAVTKAQIGLGSVENTSDAAKPISTATQSALDLKVDKVTGKDLSTNDYTTAEKTKLSGIAAGAQVNTITGVKGNAETAYRTGQVNITPANIGLGNVNNTADSAKNVLSATKLSTARTISLSGDVTGSVSFDGSGNADISATVADDSHEHSINTITGLASQLSAKQATITGGASSIASSNLTANRALISSSDGKVAVSPVTAQELAYLDGVTSGVQSQIDTVKQKFTNYENSGQLGGAVKVAKTGENLNNYTTPGIYNFASDYTPVNIPAGVNGWLIVMPWSMDNLLTCKQFWLRHGTLEENDFCIYVRTRIDSVWGTWSEVATSKSRFINPLSLTDNLITANSNLNSYKTIGAYRGSGTDFAASLTNCPTLYNFKMTVEYLSSNNYLLQTVIDRTAATYRRVCDMTTGAWTDWKSF